MSKSRRMYEEGYGCSCHLHPPCGFCESLTEEEAEALWSGGGIRALEAYWTDCDAKEDGGAE